MEMLYRYGGMNNREIGEMLGVDYSTVSVGRKRLGDRMEHDSKLRRRVGELEKELGIRG
jgi:transposase